MSDLRSRIPAQGLIEKTLNLQQPSSVRPNDDATSWYAGAVGEIAVAGILSWLGPEWTVLHSVPVGPTGADIDHVVIGPPGVFTINTKNHAGQRVWISGWSMFVSGHSTPYISKAASEANRAADLLSDASGITIPVRPMIVLVSPGERRVKGEPEGDVRVVADWELLESLQLRREFSDDQIARIVAAAVEPCTWHASLPTETDTRALAIRFNALLARTEVVTAISLVTAPGSRAVRNSSGRVEVLAVDPPDARNRVTVPSEPTTPVSRRSRRTARPILSDAIAVALPIGIALWAFIGLVLPTI